MWKLHVGFASWKLVPTRSRKVVKGKQAMNSSCIHHLAAPGGFLFLALSVIEKKKLTLNYPPPILPIHGKGVKINVIIQDNQRKAN